jgi:hypothetical protein
VVRAIFSARLAVLPALLVLSVSGCDERADASTPDASAAQTPATPSGSARAVQSAAPSASAPAPEKAPLQLLKLVFTSEVKNREPVDKLERAEPGQRVWAHFTLRNRCDARTISVVFRVNGDQRSKVDLKVDNSWSFRTWAYNTLRAGDTSGEITVEARDEAGVVVASASLPIKGPEGAKPLHTKPEIIND